MTLTGPGVEIYPHIFAQGELRSVKMANRCIVSPMTRTSATEDGLATEQMAEYYARFARGGWGMVITEAAYIDLKYSQGYTFQPGIATNEQAESWRKVIDAVHAEGAPIFMQIFHGGAINQGNNWVEGSISASAVTPRGEQIPRYRGAGTGFQTPREITRDEMAQVVEDFGHAARRAVEIGFDGVEVHGANGYLLDQFLTVHTNLREDEYGGPIEKRVKFHCDVMQSVRDAAPNVPVGVRISQTKVNDLTYVWPDGDDDAKVVFPAIAATGIDFFDCSAHLGLDHVFGTDRSLSGLARRHTGLPVFANGKLHDPELADRAIAEEEGDFVAIAKGALADPEWPQKIAAGLEPVPFNPAMVMPFATLDCNEAFWKENPSGVPDEPVVARDGVES